MAPKDKFPKIAPDLYAKITLNELVVHAVYFLNAEDNGVAPDDIILACFRLFPKRFSLKKYPRWPDSAMVNRHWNICRAKGYISGDTAKGFRLTAQGLRLAEKVDRKLGAIKPRTKKAKAASSGKSAGRQGAGKPMKRETQALRPTRPTPKDARARPSAAPVKTRPPVAAKKVRLIQPIMVVTSHAPQVDKARAAKFVRMIETSDAFVHYRKNGNKARISEFDFRSMLLCTMESSPETLARNVALFKGYASLHNRQDLIAFLNYCEEYFSSLLTPSSRQTMRKLQRRIG
jgi:hypothetical protein